MRPFYTQAQQPNIALEPAALYLTLVAPRLSAHVRPSMSNPLARFGERPTGSRFIVRPGMPKLSCHLGQSDHIRGVGTMRRINVAVVVLIGVASAGIVVSAAQSGSTVDAVWVLQELVSEVRQLRIVIEQSSRFQAQAQVLGSQLTTQQRRVSEIVSRVDTTRKELDGLIARARGTVNELAHLENLMERLNDPQKTA
jgi:hypothetical protein